MTRFNLDGRDSLVGLDDYLTRGDENSAGFTAVSGGWHRGFRVWFDPPPIPVRTMDWHFEHDDFDGAPDAHDHRAGHGSSAADCVRQIDGMLDDDDEQARYEAETSDLSDDRDALASAGFIEED